MSNNYKIINFCGFTLGKKKSGYFQTTKKGVQFKKKKNTHNSFGVLIKKSWARAVRSA